MDERVVLIASVGQTDLQVLVSVGGGDRQWYAPVKPNCSLDFHAWLAANEHMWVLRNDLGRPYLHGAVGTPTGTARFKLEWTDANGFVAPELEGRKVIPVRDDQDRLQLVAPKLDPVVRDMIRGSRQVAGALVIATRQPELASDPIEAGPIIAKWLAERLSLHCDEDTEAATGEGGGRSTWLAALEDGERLFTPNPRDQPILRVAAQRIDDGIRRAARSAGVDAEAHVALGGGIPGFKPIIEASARLHFNGKVRHVLVGEGVEAQWSFDENQPPSSTESLRGRHRVAELIRSGLFEGADLSIEGRLRGDKSESRWVDTVTAVRKYLDGSLGRAERHLLPAPLRPLMPVRPRCLRIGLRAEAALVAQRYIEAVTWTRTFFEAAVLDAIEKLTWVQRVNELDESLELVTPNAVPNQLTHPFEHAALRQMDEDGKRYRYRFGGQSEWERWRGAGFDDGTWDALSDMRRSLEDPVPVANCAVAGGSVAPYRLRNLAVHAELPPNLVRCCQEVFTEAGLWSRPEEPAGGKLLASVRVAAVLTALGVTDAPEHYRSLVQSVESMCKDHALDG